MGSLIGLTKERRVWLTFQVHVSQLSHCHLMTTSQAHSNMSQCVELGCQHGASPLWLDHGVCCHAGVSHWHCHVTCWHVVAVRSVCSHPGSSGCAWHTEPNQEDPTPILRWSRLGDTRSTCGNGGTNVACSRCSIKWGISLQAIGPNPSVSQGPALPRPSATSDVTACGSSNSGTDSRLSLRKKGSTNPRTSSVAYGCR